MVTVIVPIYKTEKYLDRCIRSIVGQTWEDLEILLIDDGSPDSCPEICEEWAERDCRVRVVHKENQGLGMARNTGIAMANGEYLCFVDSDDHIVPETVTQAMAAARKTRADVVIYGMMDVGLSGKVLVRKVPRLPQKVYRGREVREKFLPELLGPDPKTGKSARIFRNLGGCMIAKSLIHRAGWQIPSEREIISEDSYALLDLFGFAETVAVVSEAFYGYFCENPESLTHTYRPDRFEKIRKTYDACVKLCRDRSYPAEVERRCGDLMLDLSIGAMKQASDGELREILEDELLRKLLEEKKGNRVNWKKALLFWAIREGKYTLVRALVAAKKAVSGRA